MSTIHGGHYQTLHQVIRAGKPDGYDQSGVHAPLFHAHAGRCPVSLQVSGVDHHSFLFAVLDGQTSHHPGEDALIAPSFPSVV